VVCFPALRNLATGQAPTNMESAEANQDVDDEVSDTPDSFDDIDIEYATAMADRARTLMAKHGIPPTPQNYSVWFQYCLGTWRQFNKTIEILATRAAVRRSG
jgi:hypothetical protein